MQLWKVNFSGYVIIKAPDEKAAEEVFDDGLEEYKEYGVDSVEPVNGDFDIVKALNGVL